MKGGYVQKFQCIILRICRIRLFWAIAIITGTALISGSALAAGESKTGATDTKPEDEPIHITAEQLISNDEEKYAEFIGDVKATQADFVMTSDKLRIYYVGDLLTAEEKSSNEEQLKKIVANGNVKIRSDKYSADTDEAEYEMTTRTIILIGDNSKVFSGKNSITGSKITLNRNTGQYKVEGEKNKRIKAIIYSKGGSSDVFKIGKPEE